MPTVLIATADDEMAEIVIAALTVAGFAARRVADRLPEGADANHGPAALILDVASLMDEVGARLLAQASNAGLAVVVVTDATGEAPLYAWGRLEELSKLAKPISIWSLLEDLDRQLRRAGHKGEEIALSVSLLNYAGMVVQGGEAAARSRMALLRDLTVMASRLAGGDLRVDTSDSFLVAFPNAVDALTAAVKLQLELANHNDEHPAVHLDVTLCVDDLRAAAKHVSDGSTVVTVPASVEPGSVLVTQAAAALLEQSALLAMKPAKSGQGGVAYYVVPPRVPARGRPTRNRAPWVAAAAAAACLLLVVAVIGRPPFGAAASPPADRSPGSATPSFADLLPAALPSIVRLSGKTADGGAVATGTGVVYHTSGLVLTNQHVVADLKDVVVELQGGSAVPGRVVGEDANLDLAVVQLIGTGPFPALPPATDTTLRTGDEVVAVGYPSSIGASPNPSVTRGIVSQAEQTVYRNLIQVDAAINPGVSGGALLDRAGRWVGVVTAKLEKVGDRTVEGVGFAIPTASLSGVLARLEGRETTEQVAPPVAQLKPADVVTAFYTQLHAGQVQLAYGLLSPRLRSTIPPDGLLATLGLAGAAGISILDAAPVPPGDARIRASLVVTRIQGGQVVSSPVSHTWTLVQDSSQWVLDSVSP